MVDEEIARAAWVYVFFFVCVFVCAFCFVCFWFYDVLCGFVKHVLFVIYSPKS